MVISALANLKPLATNASRTSIKLRRIGRHLELLVLFGNILGTSFNGGLEKLIKIDRPCQRRSDLS